MPREPRLVPRSSRPSPASLPGADTPLTTYASFCAWLGRRSHARAALRTPNPVRNDNGADLVRLANILWPWKVFEYPGRERMAAHVLGISKHTAHKLMAPSHGKLGPSHKARIAHYVRAHIARLEAFLAELDRK